MNIIIQLNPPVKFNRKGITNDCKKESKYVNICIVENITTIIIQCQAPQFSQNHGITNIYAVNQFSVF